MSRGRGSGPRGGSLGAGIGFWTRVREAGGWLLAATADPRWLRRFGTAALLSALVVAFLPGLVPWGLVAPLAAVASVGVVVVLGFAVGLLGLVVVRRSDGQHRGEGLRLPSYDADEVAPARRVGAAVDEPLTTLTEDPESTSATDRERAAAAAKSELRPLAVETLAATAGVDRGTAARRVDEGTWTEDPRAAAFLCDGDAVRVPLRLRVLDWVRGEPVAARIEASVAEIARHAERDGAVDAVLVDDAADDERAAALDRLDEVLEAPPGEPAAADGGERP